MTNEIYISKKERVAATYAGTSEKYGVCERTGAHGHIYHYRAEKRTASGHWNEVFSMFVVADYIIQHLEEYSQVKWMLRNGSLFPELTNYEVPTFTIQKT